MTENSQNSSTEVKPDAGQYSVSALGGAVVKRAQSSLDSFALIFEDGRGLLMTARADENESLIDTEVVEGSAIAPPAEAVCAVDWSWIYGQTVMPGGVKESNGVNGAVVKIALTGVGVITVASGMWQGKPFLSFMPYKPTR
ncbi:MAG: hypothetical protein JSS83_10555 [Cyanobacteria bacterium SZAS LIN-3]|nr:hypothetical protein [Cyanobacteria bacterium SZAS LIN-3]